MKTLNRDMSNQLVNTQIIFPENNFIINVDEIKKGEIILEKRGKTISQIDAKYKIIEKVIDNRGTSSPTSKECIFVSEKLTNQDPRETSEFMFNFPDKNINALPTFNMENINIY
jgi:hypothetical protein